MLGEQSLYSLGIISPVYLPILAITTFAFLKFASNKLRWPEKQA